MSLNYDQTKKADYKKHFSGGHWVHAPLPNDGHLLIITGIAKFNFAGISNGPEWYRERLNLNLIFPKIANEQKYYFQVENRAVFFAISGISKEGNDNPIGWNIDDFGITLGEDRSIPIGGPFEAWVNFSLLGEGAYMHSVTYTVSLRGVIKEKKPSSID